MSEYTNYKGLLTEELFHHVRRRANNLAKLTQYALTADDFINNAVVRLLSRKEHVLRENMRAVFLITMRNLYVEWVSGSNGKPTESLENEPEVQDVDDQSEETEGGDESEEVEELTVPTVMSEQDEYMAAVSMEKCENVKALQVEDPSPRLMLLLDVERAIHGLDAEEQQIVRWRYWDELTLDEIAVRLRVSPSTLDTRWRGIAPKLRVALVAYKPGRGDKRSIASNPTAA